MNLQGAATQMRLCNHDRCIDPTNDLTPHQANTGDPLYGSSVPCDALFTSISIIYLQENLVAVPLCQRMGCGPKPVRYTIPRTVQQMTRFNRMGQNPYTEFRILPLALERLIK